MNEINIRISVGQEATAISGAPPIPVPLEQIGTGMVAMTELSSIAMPPEPSAAVEGIEGLPVPASSDQLSAESAGETRLPVPSKQFPETEVATPVPLSIEELTALAAASSPKKGG